MKKNKIVDIASLKGDFGRDESAKRLNEEVLWANTINGHYIEADVTKSAEQPDEDNKQPESG